MYVKYFKHLTLRHGRDIGTTTSKRESLKDPDFWFFEIFGETFPVSSPIGVSTETEERIWLLNNTYWSIGPKGTSFDNHYLDYTYILITYFDRLK